ncbi:MAG: PIN domain-containing protein [Phycisphaerae bacterium]|nr:PIN domain-containing protein [Phycisphaerae bacterium]
MRIYLDVCCLCRPFDDQSVDRNRLEAEAVVTILRHVHQHEWRMIGSDAIDAELNRIVHEEKREFARGLLALRTESIAVDEGEISRMNELCGLGFAPLDALHLACAEAGVCDVFLTTDDGIRRTAARHTAEMHVRIENPLDWIREQFRHEFDRDDA